MHPPQPLLAPTGTAVDPFGDIYVASYGLPSANGTEGRIDVFGPDGAFITQVPDAYGPQSLAVDSNGNLYVFEQSSGVAGKIRRFSPSSYEPNVGNLAYENPPSVVSETLEGAFRTGLAINPANDHLFANDGFHLNEYGSATGGNVLLDDTIGLEERESSPPHTGQIGLAIDAEHNLIYASNNNLASPSGPYEVEVFALDPPHALLASFGGTALPEGKYLGEPSIAVDEETGDFFTYFDGSPGVSAVYRFAPDGTYIGKIEHDFKYQFNSQIAIDNGPTSPNRGSLFVPSHPSGTGHSFAFTPSDVCAPEILSTGFDSVAATEAELKATINPCNDVTSYTFEYTTQERFEAEGFAGAQLAGQGELPVAQTGIAVSAPAFNLAPQTSYRFRVIASNSVEAVAEEGSFITYPLEAPETCANEQARTAFSALLPDCRAYELVTPADTNDRTPSGVGYLGTYFATQEASPDGEKLSFLTEGGAIAGYEGTGSLGGDPYLSTRGPDGWTTASAGPTGAEAASGTPGSTSPDQGFSFWATGGLSGSAVIGGADTTYVRYPDGHSALVGRGSKADDPRAEGKLISENGKHIIFVSGGSHSAIQLEADAPPSGTWAIYDRTADEVTHVVSLLPGDETPKAGENALFQGASRDGRGVAFTIGTVLYLRRDNVTTYEVANTVTFAGVAEGGRRVFYLAGGNLKAFDAETGSTIAFSASGNVTPVNVSPDGTAAYFVSPSVLTAKANPDGAKAKAGKENLYLSREGAIQFVGIVTTEDVEEGGLGLWTEVIGIALGPPGRLARDPSRTTPDGNVLLFESKAPLGSYDPEGHTEVYRYDAAADTLDCLSCNPTGAPATGEASLQSIGAIRGDPEPFSSYGPVANLRADGRRAFFQSTEPLVARDNDGMQDVYEWEAAEVGSCTRAGGCIYLLSSGQSGRTDYLYAVGATGNDVFLRSSDLLLSADADETPSIYDARVEGGFPEQPSPEGCEGEGCRPGLSSAPALAPPQTPVLEKQGRCPKGKRKVKRHGRFVCVKKHRKHKAGTKKKGASR